MEDLTSRLLSVVMKIAVLIILIYVFFYLINHGQEIANSVIKLLSILYGV